MTGAAARSYTFRQRLILALVPWLAATFVRLLLATCRKEVRGVEHFNRLRDENRLALAGFWHETIGLIAGFHWGKGFCTLTSQSFDGELAARLVMHLGSEAVRGSSSQGSVEALKNMQAVIAESKVMAYTLDGPKGPRRVAKSGIGYLAAATQYPILPVACAARKAWRLNSWDRFIVPRPFTRIICAYGAPIEARESASAESWRATAAQVTEELNRLHAEIEDELGADPMWSD